MIHRGWVYLESLRVEGDEATATRMVAILPGPAVAHPSIEIEGEAEHGDGWLLPMAPEGTVFRVLSRRRP